MLGVDVPPSHARNINLTHKSNANQSPHQQLLLTPPTPTTAASPASSVDCEGKENTSVNVIKSSCSDFFTAEYEINALKTPTRNFLSKGEVHDEISQDSGTSISIRGRYISLEEETPVITHPRPLYLYIQGKTEKSVLLAIDKINEIIANNSNQLETDEKDTRKVGRMTKFNNRPPPAMAPQQNANSQQKSTFAEKLMIGLEHAPPTFNLREQVIGAGGANLNYIRNETGAVATLRGRGSLFIDPSIGAESPEPLHLYIEHYRYEGLQAAKQLAKNLIETLQQELVHFQQLNQNTQNVTFSSAGTIIPQGQHVPQINVPPPMLAVPPPQIIQQNPIDPQNNQTTVMQQNFIQQNPPPTINAPTQTVQSSQQTVIHQQIIPQTVPIQLQQGNMVIQQQVQQPPTIGNVNIPPPGIPIPIKAGQIVQFQQPPPPPGAPHLTQPPPNVQIQHPQQATQIVLNPTQNYQYQYIQQPVQTAEAQMQPNQVTIQHIYQPQQQIQGIMQTVPPHSQAQTIEQYQQMRPQFQTAPSQQYITVQGSTAYMVPPPTIIHQQQPSQHQQTQSVSAQITTSNPNIIIQPPPQLQSMQMQMQPTISLQNLPPPPPVQPPPTMQEQVTQANGTDDSNRSSPMKEENKIGSDSDENSRKTPEEKSENDCQANDGSGDNSTQSPNTSTALTLPPPPPPPTQNHPQSITIRPPPPQHLTSITLPATQVPPPIMAVPPPITCVQHLVGNTLITTHPQTQTHTNQIYNQVQVPVSIHQIQPAAQQIHVSTASGQHFVVNATPQWQSAPPPTAQLTQQHQMQQISSNGTIQNVQITHQQIASTGADFRTIPPPGSAPPPQATSQQQSIMAINPQVQVQFQPQMLQQFPPPHTIESAQIISGQVSQPPPQFNVVQSQPQNLHLPPGAYQQSHNTIMTSFPQQIKQFIDQPSRFGNKRKMDEEDGCPPNHQPRMGMGPREQQNPNQNMMPSTSQGQQQMQPPTSSHSSAPSIGPLAMTSSVGGSAISSLNKGTDESNGQKNQHDRSGVLQQHQQHLMHNQPPPPPPPIPNSQYHHHQDNRSMYKRDGSDSHMDGHPQRLPHYDGPPSGMVAGPPPHGPGPRGPRFHHGNGMMGPGPGFGMRPPHHMQDGGGGNFPMHRMNFGPPPPPPTYRGDCPPNMGGGYGPPPPRFRGQW